LRQLPPFAALPDPNAAHVTLARVRPRATPRDGDRLEAALREMDVRPRDLRLMRVQLVASTLAPDGPQYRTLEAWSLHDTSRRA
jgi:2'-5' RNA ligase